MIAEVRNYSRHSVENIHVLTGKERMVQHYARSANQALDHVRRPRRVSCYRVNGHVVLSSHV